MEALTDLEGAEAFAAFGQPILVGEGFGLEEAHTGEGPQTCWFRRGNPGRKIDIADFGRVGLAVEGR